MEIDTMRVKIHFFASLKEITGRTEIEMELTEPALVSTLVEALFLQFPSLKASERNILISVNQEFASSTQILCTDDEIALFPPVSGG